MSGTECECKNPNGGGTRCPEQNIAFCFRGKDRECFGECIPIPRNYTSFSMEFNDWARESLIQAVTERVSKDVKYGRVEGYREFYHRPEEDMGLFDGLSNGSGKFELVTSSGEKIRVNYTFSFERGLDSPNEKAFMNI